MDKLKATISVQVNIKDKEKAISILKNLGLNMSAYINMAIKQLINKNAIPIEITNNKTNKL